MEIKQLNFEQPIDQGRNQEGNLKMSQKMKIETQHNKTYRIQ
jgi:hypothetical protein